MDLVSNDGEAAEMDIGGGGGGGAVALVVAFVVQLRALFAIIIFLIRTIITCYQVRAPFGVIGKLRLPAGRNNALQMNSDSNSDGMPALVSSSDSDSYPLRVGDQLYHPGCRRHGNANGWKRLLVAISWKRVRQCRPSFAVVVSTVREAMRDIKTEEIVDLIMEFLPVGEHCGTACACNWTARRVVLFRHTLHCGRGRKYYRLVRAQPGREVYNCATCAAPSVLRCAGCLQAFYCDRAHQKRGWRMHRDVCSGYSTRRRTIVGHLSDD